MSNLAVSNHHLLLRGLYWLETHRNEIVEAYAGAMLLLPGFHYRYLSLTQRLEIAQLNIQHIISRLRGKQTVTASLKNTFVEKIQQGVDLQELTSILDLFSELVYRKAQNDMINEPEVCETLLKKITYISQLLKVNMAAAVIEYDPTPSERYSSVA